MHTTSVSVSSATTSAWVPLDRAQAAFGVGFNVDLDSVASGITFRVEHTFDDTERTVQGSLSRTLFAVTAVFQNHNLNVGDSVTILNGDSLANATGLSGTFNVATVVDANTFTYTSPVTGTVGITTGIMARLLRVQPHSSITSNSTSVDGNYAFPITAMRLNVTAWIAGKATLTVVQGRK